MPTVDYRLLHNIAEFEDLTNLEILIWGLNPRDAAPSNFLHALAYNDSAVLGAFVSDKLIGLSVAFPAKYPRGLWSHMTGVHPDYQSQDIGHQLKLHQQAWALERGYRTIHWTFDPMQRGNAHFNIRKLGATAQIYHPNYYGDMQDEINLGLPSDRLEASWDIRKPSKKIPQNLDYPQDAFLLHFDHQLCTQPLNTDFDQQFLEIPFKISDLKRNNLDLALNWQHSVRQILQDAFSQGYRISDFVIESGRCWYVLTPPVSWYMYVVECRDSSLYTGITNNLDRRIDQHNRGKGAAYTASRRPVSLRAVWRLTDQGSALRAEAAFKRKTRQEKWAHIHDQRDFLDGTFVKSD